MRQFFIFCSLICLFTTTYGKVGIATPGKTILVGKARQINTIQKGVSLAQNGDTVLVDAGVYKEGQIAIKNSIVLKGINHPVIDGENKHEILFVQGKEITIDGFRLQNTGRSEIKDIGAIMIYDSYHVTAINNIIDNANFGISLQNSKSCTVKNNKITAYGKDEVQSGNGIHCWKSDSLLIIANTITGHRDGLYFEFVTNTLAWRNISRKNIRYGIHFMFSHHNTYISNVFEENASGVAVMFTHHIHMYNNFFLDNWGGAAYGILLKEINDGEISGNHFSHNTTGIQMEGCSRNHIYKNIFSDNGFAIKISASSIDNNIQQNNFQGNTFDIGTSGTLVLNNFNGNYWDKYEGYDLNRDNVGDVPFHPVSMFSMIIESNPAALMLFRSTIVSLLDKSEKILPGITPVNLLDETPSMRPLPL
ncbi:MAG: nitrous oxide reductase family maturation protein NosD [Ginsengibacter sp.]